MSTPSTLRLRRRRREVLRVPGSGRAQVREQGGELVELLLLGPKADRPEPEDHIAANPAFALVTEGAAPELTAPGSNVYRLALHPDGMAPRVLNFAQWARHILERITEWEDLHAEPTTYVSEPAPASGHPGFAVPLRLRSSEGELRLMTTVTTFATAVDVTLNELKLEAFPPVDEPTATALRRFAIRSAT